MGSFKIVQSYGEFNFVDQVLQVPDRVVTQVVDLDRAIDSLGVQILPGLLTHAVDQAFRVCVLQKRVGVVLASAVTVQNRTAAYALPGGHGPVQGR